MSTILSPITVVWLPQLALFVLFCNQRLTRWVVDAITRTSHSESFTVSGTGYMGIIVCYAYYFATDRRVWPQQLGADVEVILTPPCIFCMEYHR
jgi:hypothetical protein